MAASSHHCHQCCLFFLCGMFPEAFTFGAGVSSQSFFGPFACFGFVLWSVAHRRGLRARLSLVYGLFTFHYWLFCWPFSNSFFFFPTCIADFGQYLPARTRFHLGNLVSLSSLPVKHRHWFVRCRFAAVSFYSQSVAWCSVLPSALFQGCRPILPL